MSTFELAWDQTTKVVRLLGVGDTPATGFVSLGNVTADVAPGEFDAETNHVLYQEVQTRLYKEGVQDMNNVVILMGAA